MAREIEAKIALWDGEMSGVRARLTALGAQRGRLDYEENMIFQLSEGHERCHSRSLRLRTFAGRGDAVLTCKGPVQRNCDYKSREETEVAVSDAASANALLAQLGYRLKASYAKRREHWHLNGAIVALDHLAFGDYVEVEGTVAAIRATLISLGLHKRPHIRDSYARLSKRLRQPKRSRPNSLRALRRAS